MNAILFGTPEFSLPAAETLRQLDEVKLQAVVTTPDKTAGRGKRLTAPVLKSWALQHTIPVLQPQKLNEAFIKELQQYSPTVGVIASYGKIIPRAVLEAFPHGIINIHPSLLPRHRGASPVQATILAGDTVAGVTLMLTDEELDHGPIIAQESFPTWPHETARELKMRLAEHAAQLLKETLPRYVSGEITPTQQDHSRATTTTMFTRDDGRIDWSGPADVIERMVRALDPWPGTFTVLPDEKRLKVLYIEVLQQDGGEQGEVQQADDGMPIVRAADAWVKLVKVQPEGKQPMDGSAFLNGHKDLIGKKLT